MTNNVSKVAAHKINSNKWVVFLYTNDKGAEKEIRKTILFTIATNNIKYLGVTHQASERSIWQELQVPKERNQKPQKIKWYPMLMDW